MLLSTSDNPAHCLFFGVHHLIIAATRYYVLGMYYVHALSMYYEWATVLALRTRHYNTPILQLTKLRLSI